MIFVADTHTGDQPYAQTFFGGTGEMRELLRRYDWSSSPLGAVEEWQQSLKTAVSICLTTPFVAAVHWGADLRTLYNDAYIPALAERHPRSSRRHRLKKR